MNKPLLWSLVGVTLVVVVGVAYMRSIGVFSQTPPGEAACTMEAKLCPDGSYVGRSGPLCEFAPCPTTAQPAVSTVEAHINETASVPDMSIKPLEVIEDSRCPIDVQCIQAGTVRLNTKVSSAIGEGEMIFTLGKSITVEGAVVTLTNVRPAKVSTEHLSPSDYVFVFSISKR